MSAEDADLLARASYWLVLGIQRAGGDPDHDWWTRGAHSLHTEIREHLLREREA